MPNFISYLGDILAVWIVFQIVTGNAMYRRTRVSQQDDKRSFWALIGLESLIVIPMVCFQFHLNRIAIAVFLILVTIIFGFILYVLWMLLDVITHPKRLWKQLCQQYEADPKKFLRELFFGR